MLNVAIEEIARACASSALILMIQELGTLPIKLFGSDELKQRFLPRCASGEWSPAFALSEPEAGSDPGGMITRAVRDGDDWVVTGTKNWITNLGVADFYVVFAKTDPKAGRSRGISAFVVEADRPGFSVGKLEHKLGIKGSPTGQPIFDDVRVPGGNLIGEVGKGMHVALGTLDHSRLGVAAQAVGIAQGATDHAAAYARERRQFGRAIAEFQGDPVQARRHGDAHRRRARAALPGVREDRPRTSPTPASTRRWPSCSPPTPRWRVTVEAVQVLGGYGYVTEYPVERYMRDAKITQIYEGTERDPAARDRAHLSASVWACSPTGRLARRIAIAAVVALSVGDPGRDPGRRAVAELPGQGDADDRDDARGDRRDRGRHELRHQPAGGLHRP